MESLTFCWRSFVNALTLNAGLRAGGRLISIFCACLISALVLAAFESKPVAGQLPLAFEADAARFNVHLRVATSAPNVIERVADTVVDEAAEAAAGNVAQKQEAKQLGKIAEATQSKPTLKSASPEVFHDEPSADEPLAPTLQAALLDSTADFKASQTANNASRLALPQYSQPTFAQVPVAPNYPKSARKRGQEGTVLLEIWLDDLGRQTHLAVQNSSGVSSLDKAAVTAVSSWRFLPLKQNGQAIASRLQVPVEFVLN